MGNMAMAMNVESTAVRIRLADQHNLLIVRISLVIADRRLKQMCYLRPVTEVWR